jgi:hypothetical protein
MKHEVNFEARIDQLLYENVRFKHFSPLTRTKTPRTMSEVSKKRPLSEVEEPSQLSSEEIVQIVEQIHARPGGLKEKQRIFRKIYPEFAEQYPSMFNMACEPSFDIDRLKFMLQMRDAVTSNKISQHNASVKVGENLFTEYIKPIVDIAPRDK